MQDQVLSCRDARSQIAACLNGGVCPGLPEHLMTCDDCMESCIEAALATPTEVLIPEYFRDRLLSQVPTAALGDATEFRWGMVAVGLLVTFAMGLWWTGEVHAVLTSIVDSLRRPIVLIGVTALEIVSSILWLRRVLIDEP
jgi:hypothetical protein